VGVLKKSTLHRYTPASLVFTSFIFNFASLGSSAAEKYNRSPKSPDNAECVASFSFPPFLESKLYKGIPVLSLNHNTNLTESCNAGVRSQGNSTSLLGAAQITRAGTVTKKRKINIYKIMEKFNQLKMSGNKIKVYNTWVHNNMRRNIYGVKEKKGKFIFIISFLGCFLIFKQV
jgi:hypothetical protein